MLLSLSQTVIKQSTAAMSQPESKDIMARFSGLVEKDFFYILERPMNSFTDYCTYYELLICGRPEVQGGDCGN